MRRFATIAALTLVASTTFFAGAARADEGQPVAPTSAPTEAGSARAGEGQPVAPTAAQAEAPLPQQVPPPPPRSASTEPSTLRRPKTIPEFKAARDELEKRLDDASEEERFRIRKDLRLLQHWYEADTERTSRSAFVTGVVMLSAGGGVAFLSGVTLAMNANGPYRVESLLGPMIGGGLAVAGIGVGLIVYGSPRVMKADSQTSATRLFSPSARLLVSPGMTGIGGTF